MTNIRRATVADAVAVAPRLRQADRAECIAAYGMIPEVLVPLSVASPGETWAMIGDDGTVVGLFGVSPVALHPHFGIVWAVTTDDLYKHRRAFIRETPKVLAMLHRMYPLLGNHIDARNVVHIRWLKKLGFSFLRTHQEFGHERRPFHEFARLRSP